MFADVRNPRSVDRLVFLRYHNGIFNLGLRDYERICKVAALKELFPVKVLSKMGNGVDAGDEGQLFHSWIFKEIRIACFQLADNRLVEFPLQLVPCLTYRN